MKVPNFGLLELTGGGLEGLAQREPCVGDSPGATATRTEHVVELEIPGVRGLVALVAAEPLELRLPTVQWIRGASESVPASRLLRQAKVVGLTDERLSALSDEVAAPQPPEFNKSRIRGDEVPREGGHGNACRGRVEKHLGVVH